MQSDKEYAARLLRIKKMMEKEKYTLGQFVPGQDIDVDNMLTWPKEVRNRLLSHIGKEPGTVYKADHVGTLLENFNLLVDWINVKMEITITKISEDTFYTLVEVVEPESFNLNTIRSLCDMAEQKRIDDQKKELQRQTRKRKAAERAAERGERSDPSKKAKKERKPKVNIVHVMFVNFVNYDLRV